MSYEHDYVSIVSFSFKSYNLLVLLESNAFLPNLFVHFVWSIFSWKVFWIFVNLWINKSQQTLFLNKNRFLCKCVFFFITFKLQTKKMLLWAQKHAKESDSFFRSRTRMVKIKYWKTPKKLFLFKFLWNFLQDQCCKTKLLTQNKVSLAAIPIKIAF